MARSDLGLRACAAAILGYGEATGQLGPHTLRWVEKSAIPRSTPGRSSPGGRKPLLHIVRTADNFARTGGRNPIGRPRPSQTRGGDDHHGWQPAALRRAEVHDPALRGPCPSPEQALADIRQFLKSTIHPALRRPTRRPGMARQLHVWENSLDQRRPVGRSGSTWRSGSDRPRATPGPEMSALAMTG
jgi:hypothetical protein